MDVEGIGGRELRDADADSLLSVVIEIGAVVFGTEFGATHIAQAYQSAVVVALEDDVVKLRGFGKAADGADTDLKLLAWNCGLRTDLSGGDFDVLLGERAHDIGRGQGAAGHFFGIEPEAHGILALSEDENFGHAGNTLEAVANVNIKIIAHEERRVASIRREDGAAKDKILRTLLNGNSDLLDCIGEASLGGIDAVLNIYRGKVGVAGEIEGGGNRTHAIVGRGGSYVLHPFSAVDLLLEGCGDSRFDCLRAGSSIETAHGDLRRSEIGELGDWERGDNGGARKNDEQRADGRENGAVNEEINHRGNLRSLVASRWSLVVAHYCCRYRSYYVRGQAMSTPLCPRVRCSLSPLRGSFLRNNGDAVNQELGSGDDNFVSGLDSVQYNIVVAYDFANLQGLLVDYVSALGIGLGDESEIESADGGPRRHARE